MGLCNERQDITLDHFGKKPLICLYGDCFQPETRSLLLLLQLAHVQHSFKEVDQFMGDYKEEDYTKINPTGSLPTLAEGKFVILGGYQVFINYLVNHHLPVRDKLLPSEIK